MPTPSEIATAALLDPHRIAELSIVLGFRVLPFCVHAVLDARARPWICAGFIASSLALAAASFGLSEHGTAKFAFVLVGSLYFVALGFSVHHIGRSPARGAIGRALQFSAICALCVVVPAYSFPRGSLPLVVVVAYGFELALAAYSYCRVAPSRRSHPTLGDCLFFLFVNPELVFPGRGRTCRPQPLRGMSRTLLGCALMLLATTVGRALQPIAPPLELAAWKAGVLHGAVGFMLLYATHSALAHMQIGLCRVIGYAAPERYDLPFVAASPQEFWARWNRYIGAWLRAYVYTPLARTLPDRCPRSLRTGLATLGAFLWLGAYHDAYWWLTEHRLATNGLLGFGVWGLVFWAWQPLHRFVQTTRAGWRRHAARELSRLATLGAMCVSVWMFL